MRTIVRSRPAVTLKSVGRPLSSLSSPRDLAEPPAQTAHDQRREQVLAAARHCFALSGFHGASMQQICAEAQMSPGALYRYFPSKDAIIEAIAEEERANAGVCMAALSGPGPIVDRLVAVAMDYLGHSLQPPTGRLIVEICSESFRNTGVGQRFHKIEQELRSVFEAALRKAQAEGEISGDVDIEVATTMLFAIGDGLVMRLQLDPGLSLRKIEPQLRRLTEVLLGKPQA